ncbi:helix-turn-helix domain-containing protein [Cohnella silvisoli]|uniref:Helix-turn-helix transcriptional regulator n=1 Tax=Cohnella silvisoli TaxID=2873699 RepID=A0ABV1KQJ7_9BACL|nr:helix-turn-helix transcriptional regulator [Cohnella silvisoli]MCD9024663.1 helix-turn-helix domain-containing protein [Cohnella silvisoli]
MYKKIRDLREDKDITQQQMAEHLNITQATYSRYESGELDIPTAVLIKLSRFHKVSVDYLLGLTDDPKPYGRKREQD